MNEDIRWYAAYENAAERLFNKADGILTPEEDEACIAAADAEIAAE